MLRWLFALYLASSLCSANSCLVYLDLPVASSQTASPLSLATDYDGFYPPETLLAVGSQVYLLYDGLRAGAEAKALFYADRLDLSINGKRFNEPIRRMVPFRLGPNALKILILSEYGNLYCFSRERLSADSGLESFEEGVSAPAKFVPSLWSHSFVGQLVETHFEDQIRDVGLRICGDPSRPRPTHEDTDACTSVTAASVAVQLKNGDVHSAELQLKYQNRMSNRLLPSEQALLVPQQKIAEELPQGKVHVLKNQLYLLISERGEGWLLSERAPPDFGIQLPAGEIVDSSAALLPFQDRRPPIWERIVLSYVVRREGRSLLGLWHQGKTTHLKENVGASNLTFSAQPIESLAPGLSGQLFTPWDSQSTLRWLAVESIEGGYKVRALEKDGQERDAAWALWPRYGHLLPYVSGPYLPSNSIGNGTYFSPALSLEDRKIFIKLAQRRIQLRKILSSHWVQERTAPAELEPLLQMVKKAKGSLDHLIFALELLMVKSESGEGDVAISLGEIPPLEPVDLGQVRRLLFSAASRERRALTLWALSKIGQDFAYHNLEKAFESYCQRPGAEHSNWIDLAMGMMAEADVTRELRDDAALEHFLRENGLLP